MRGLVIAAIAVKFREIQTQLNGIKRAFGNAACRQCSNSRLVFRDSVSLTIFFLRQQRLDGVGHATDPIDIFFRCYVVS